MNSKLTAARKPNHPELPALPMGEHYARVTFPMSWCRHDYESPSSVARDLAREAGLTVVAVQEERGTMAVYVIEPACNDARAWDRYRAMQCSSAQRI